MGAYLRKPITDKTSECGEYTMGGRKVLYAVTAMQGWRVAMEDAHSVIPNFDTDTSLFAVYDGHGGKEVATYCAEKLGDIIRSVDSYSKGDIGQALKDAFMKCDEIITKPETVQEMKRMIMCTESDQAEVEEQGEEDVQQELNALIEDSNTPLHTLLAKYEAAKDPKAGESNQETDVKSVLQMMANQAGLEIEFDDSDSDIDPVNEDDSESEGDRLERDSGVTNSAANDLIESRQEHKAINQNTSADLIEQSDSATETNLCLASLLTSSSGDGTYVAAPVSLASSTSVPTSTQSMCDQRDPLNYQPPHDTSLSNRVRGHGNDFSGKSISNPPVEKSPISDYKNNHQLFVKRETTITPNLSEDSSIRTKPICSSDDTNSKELDCEYSTTSSKMQAAYTSVHMAATPICVDDSPSSTTRTTTIGLVDLLTTAVENKDSTLTVNSSEDEWMSRQSVKEIPFLRSRKRPHPEDDMDDLTLSEYSAKRAEIMDEEGYHSGTTAVVCIIKGDELTVANAGDSRCVVSSKGKALEMSFDHKPTDPPELERIAKAGGQVGIDGRVNGGLNLTRAIGDHFYKENTSLPLAEQMITAMPDIETLRITEDEEFMFLACDGIWNSKSSQEVVDFINCRISEKSEDGPPTADDLVIICKSLCDACLAPDTDNDGTGCDNMTCVLVLFLPDQ